MKVLKVSFKDVGISSRFDSSYHLSEGTKYLKILRSMPHKKLDDITSSIFTAGRSKRFYTGERYGFPYLSNSEVVKQNPIDDCKYNSKKFGYDEHSFLKEGMIVTGRVGAIGQTAYINSEFEEFRAMGSDNIIRIVPHDFRMSGYIYSFLVSKYGNTLLWKLAAGGVQPYISEDMIKDMPIPILTELKQEEIHKLIFEASNLRVDANKLLRVSIKEIESEFTFESPKKKFKINIQHILKGDKYTQEARLESDYYQPSTQNIIKQIQKRNWTYLGDIANEINRSGLRERSFVENGVPLITGQNLNMARLQGLKMLSRKFTRNIDRNTTDEGDILVSVQGTIGKIEYVYRNMYQGVFASEQLSKIKINSSKIHPGYIACFLRSKLGALQLLKHKTGSVIEWIKENNIASLIIPMPDDKGDKIGNNYNIATLKLEQAFQKENKAIQLVENEIESWQKS
ncbi:methylation-associated defense system restriction endonuclease subunit S MAD5 [Aquiflexum lacus]|uniref:methylation-associated defense system restriction endonuclease subunit S MAD5 n=1 Tax=Aquiflexum lacus TaxID=2483805 RepID=UPI001894CBF6|nr:restriction endonuclease subunit S [Aquiflexum lacus]